MARKAATESDGSTIQVNVAEFQSTRDSVIVALATLQQSVSELSRAYINHANTVLAPGRGAPLPSILTDVLTESGLLGLGVPAPMPDVLNPEEAAKKKRKRAPHDPNAPKRALTPYFLYMQNARAQIQKELGEQARPKEVADEGTRRWTAMTPGEKSLWEDRYQKNLSAYRVKTAAYKAGQPVPSDEEAIAIVEEGKHNDYIARMAAVQDLVQGVPVEDEESAAQLLSDAVRAEQDDEDEEEEGHEPEPEPEPVREPTPPKAKRRKVEKKAEKKTEEAPKEEPKATPAKATPKAKKESKKSAKKEKEPSPVPAPTPASATKTAGSGRKKSARKT